MGDIRASRTGCGCVEVEQLHSLSKSIENWEKTEEKEKGKHEMFIIQPLSLPYTQFLLQISYPRCPSPAVQAESGTVDQPFATKSMNDHDYTTNAQT